MTLGTLQRSAAVGTSEAASRHSCLCLPTLFRAEAVGELQELEGGAGWENYKAKWGPRGKTSLRGFLVADYYSPQIAHRCSQPLHRSKSYVPQRKKKKTVPQRKGCDHWTRTLPQKSDWMLQQYFLGCGKNGVHTVFSDRSGRDRGFW